MIFTGLKVAHFVRPIILPHYFFEVKFTEREINHFKAHSSLAFGTFTILHNHCLCLVPEHFFAPKRDLLCVKQSLLILPSLPPLATTHAPPASMELHILDILHKWNHWHFVLWFFTWHKVFEVFPWRKMDQYFIPFYGWIIPHRMHILTTFSVSIH